MQLSIRQFPPAVIFVLLGLTGCGGTNAVKDAKTPSPASSERRPIPTVGQRTALPKGMPLPYPLHGVVIAQGNLFAPGPVWEIVDFDARSITVLQTEQTQGSLGGPEQQTRVAKVVRPISEAELDKMLTEAHRVWAPNSPPLPPRLSITDSSCDVYLLDGVETLHYSGGSCPPETDRLLGAIPDIPMRTGA